MILPKHIGNYELLDVLGRGGMGVVYRARHTTTGVYRAIKKIYEQFCCEPHFSRVLSEARIQSQLIHPNIVQMFDPMELDGQVYLVMEYVNGISLSEIIKRQTGPIVIQKAIPIMNGVLEALRHIHSLGIIHRDIKPSNILISHENTVKLTDFGIAKDLQQVSWTTTGSIIGTIEYMSPEQLRGQKVDIQSDIYSTGMTFYEMLAGRLPFDFDRCDSFMSKIDKLATTDIPLPSHFYPGIPKHHESIVMDCLQKDKNKRFESVNHIITALSSPSYRQIEKTNNLSDPNRIIKEELEEKFVTILSSNMNKTETIKFLTRMGYPMDLVTSLYPNVEMEVIKSSRIKKRIRLMIGIFILLLFVGVILSFPSESPAIIGSFLLPLVASFYLIFSSITPTKIKES